MITTDTVVGQCVVVVLCLFDDVANPDSRSWSRPKGFGPRSEGQGCKMQARKEVLFWLEFL